VRATTLGQKLLQLVLPGVPDVFQGCESVALTLVDPDNRQAVDHVALGQTLHRLEQSDVGDGRVVGSLLIGEVKLWVTSRALRLRRDRPEAFGSYTPLRATGPAADHAVAFDRGGAVTVATRLPVGLDRHGGWRDTALRLPPGDWSDVLTGARFHAGPPVRLSELLARHPVALLSRDQPASVPEPMVADIGQARPAG